ncbi:MAG: four helix bundle protein [Candidatus Omnitrophica bacterium]|nr:four helix bundle protein [Candidatus Omnitrophota bacterium]
MKIKDYKDLDIWKKGVEIADKVYDITEKFPNKEMYGISVQLRRSAVSISSNVAEGFARQYAKEYKQFLFIALGSCAELETQLIISEKRKYLSGEELIALRGEIDHESKMLMSLIKKLKY